MIVESLKLQNYRNYEYLNMNFDEKINIIYGDNAQGKTNILESMYVRLQNHIAEAKTAKL